jgi:L-seryl-tRNA(Ser) seleniumtransferase
MHTDRSALRAIPSVERLLEDSAVKGLFVEVPREIVVREARALLDALREGLEPALLGVVARGETAALIAALVARARAAWRAGVTRVINATGVVLHTNLGRAPLSRAAIDAVAAVAGVYSDLEYDVARGERSTRLRNVSSLLAHLAGAEDALVVNNNAAAILLVVNTLAAGREVIVSRGELIEIGDGFRIPEILSKSGANLVEVGTTNRTTAADYERAIGRRSALLMKMHRSNFRIEGFVSEASLPELAAIAAKHELPLVEDLGSGAIVDLAGVGLDEPRVADSIARGAHLVTASGDKLLGGPQAGIVAGRGALISAMKRNPLMRALRIDKMTLAALEATLKAFCAADRGAREVPVIRMLSRDSEELAREARSLAARIESAAGPDVTASVIAAASEAGGGAQPVTPLPTTAVAVRHRAVSAEELARRLRAHTTPIVARVSHDDVLFDPRTLFPGDAAEIGAFFEGMARAAQSGDHTAGAAAQGAAVADIDPAPSASVRKRPQAAAGAQPVRPSRGSVR